ncbi:BnaA08g01950D [Brassica napus]|uniref:BnaA08g01950D protein n=1 Tax=Brassica napus TaxID=3708 RepID=A0A078I9R3_BRANA|nr:BnaA08g01950D [Brassica napus]
MKRVYEDDEDDSLTIAQMGDGFPEKLKRSRYIRTRRSVRSEIEKGKIGDCGGSASRGVLLGDLFDKELVKRKNETVVATREIKQEEADTRSKAANENNSLDHPLVKTVVSPPETRQNCDDEVDLVKINAEKKKKKRIMVGDGTKEAKCLLHKDG